MSITKPHQWQRQIIAYSDTTTNGRGRQNSGDVIMTRNISLFVLWHYKSLTTLLVKSDRDFVLYNLFNSSNIKWSSVLSDILHRLLPESHLSTLHQILCWGFWDLTQVGQFYQLYSLIYTLVLAVSFAFS